MGSAVAIGVRAGFGLFLALFLAIAGFFVGWLVAPPGPEIPIALLIGGSGVGAGIGGFVGWFKPEAPRWVTGLHLALAVGGGVAGAWGGWVLGQMAFPQGVYNPTTPLRTPPVFVAMLVASPGANLLTSGFYIFRMCRQGEA